MTEISPYRKGKIRKTGIYDIVWVEAKKKGPTDVHWLGGEE